MDDIAVNVTADVARIEYQIMRNRLFIINSSHRSTIKLPMAGL